MPFGFSTYDANTVIPFREETLRRAIAYRNAANGTAPLAALLSLQTNDVTPDPEMQWPEGRLSLPIPDCLAIDGTFGAFAPMTGANNAALPVTVGAQLKLRLSSFHGLGVSDVLLIHECPIAGGALSSFTYWIITALDETNGQATVRLQDSSAGNFSIKNDAASWSGTLRRVASPVGRSVSEGSTTSLTHLVTQTNICRNFAQTFRDDRSWTGNALQVRDKFSKTSVYKRDMMAVGRAHLVKLENAMLWGRKSKVTDVEGKNTWTTGGIVHFLQEWEKAGGGENNYRPNEPAATTIADESRRRLDFAGAPITRDQFENNYMRRFLNSSSDSSFEKLVLCGDQFLPFLNAFYDTKIVVNRDMKEMHQFDMVDLYTLNLPSGTLHFKTHPLFSKLPYMRRGALVVDIGCMRFLTTPMRDTFIREEIQANDFDGRTDGFFTEGGLELVHPENFGMITNFGGLTA
jgi:hypothetical protein